MPDNHAPDFIRASGEMSGRVRAHDWAATPLGPIEGWPQSLRTVVSLMLEARQPIYVAWGPELTSLYNDGYIPILGAKHPAGLGKPFAEVFAEIWDEYRPVAEATMAGQAQHFVDQPVPLLGRPGRPMSWFTFSWTPLRDEAGAVAGFFCVASEASEKALAEKALAEQALRTRSEQDLHRSRSEADRQRRLYEAILSNTPDLAYVFNLDHRFIYANEGLLRMWGRSWDEAIGKTCLELGYPDWHAAMHDREIEQVVATRKPIRGQVPFTGTFGRRIYDYIFVPVIAADGRVEAVAGTTRDVTEQMETEAALRESEARLAAALSAAKMVAWRWDPAEDRIAFTGRAAEVFGLPAGATITSSIETLALLHPEDRERRRALLRDAAERGAAWQTEFRIIRPCDGKLAWLEERATAERDPATGELRMTGLLWDATERKEAEERQMLLSREVDHRAKNALAVVQSALRLTQAPDLPAYVRAVTGRISALARVQTLLAEDRWQGADLRVLLEGELAPFIGAHQHVRLEGPQVTLPAYAAQPLAMIFHELATNAVKYGALSVPGGLVTVSWRPEGEPPGSLWLRWAETGGPPLMAAPGRQGFGTRVLEGTVKRQLGGRVALTWRATGLVCEMTLPLRRGPDWTGAPWRDPERLAGEIDGRRGAGAFSGRSESPDHPDNAAEQEAGTIAVGQRKPF